MKNVLSLILVIGLLTAGWINRDKLSGLTAKSGPTVEEEAPSTQDSPVAPAQRSTATPHPAREAQAQATALYPGLALPNSALNKKFVALYKESQSTDPDLLSRPDWPLQLADRAVVSLGGAPMPRNSAAAPATPRNSAAAPAITRWGKQVVIYTTSHCPYCKQAKQYFTEKGVPFWEFDLETSPGKEAYRKLGGKGTPLIMVGGTKVAGFEAEEMDRLLL
jgi:glutaredoxin